MKKLTVAAALAVSMISFAVTAQEAPPIPTAGTAAGEVKASADKTPKRAGNATTGKTAVLLDRGRIAIVDDAAEPASKSTKNTEANKDIASVEFADRGNVVVMPGVDTMKTGSISARKSPELVATERGAKSDAKASGKTVVATSGSYGAIIARHAAANGVPVSLAHAVIRVESNYRPSARGSAGEVGLMQIKPATARGLGYSGSVKALYNPDTNIRWGMKYLGMAHKLAGGTTCGTILKYNAGHGAKRMNPVSAAYCSKVKRHLGA